jgi:hypothetical protein
VPAPEFKVVFWYHAGAWRARAYDLRKGQYTRAVDDWTRRWNAEHSSETDIFSLPHSAYVKEVRLSDHPGRSAQEALASAVKREIAKREQADVELIRALARQPRTDSMGALTPIRGTMPGAAGVSTTDRARGSSSSLPGRPSSANPPRPIAPVSPGVPTYLFTRPR